MNVNVKSKWVFSLIWAVVILMIVWIIAGTRSGRTESEIQVDQQTYTVSSQENATTADEESETDKGYFLVKAESGKVSVYWVDETGEHLHKETAIAYDLLSSEDQHLLDFGMTFDSEEALAGFLENYDS